MDLENNEAESFLTRFRQSRPEATTFVIARVCMRNMAKGMIGDATFRSTMTKAASIPVPHASAPSVLGDAQP